MARRPAHTIVFLGAQRTDRIDLGPAPAFALLAKQHLSAHGADDPATRLESALVSLPKVGAKVWILWEGANALFLDMPAGVIEGLERAQIADSLSFEAELLTNVPAGDSAIDGIAQRAIDGALPDFKRFWAVQANASVRTKMEEVVARSKAVLAGITHPGGLPRARWDAKLIPGAVAEWRRVEVWDKLTFTLHGRTDGSVDARVLRSTPGAEGWTADLPTEGPLGWLLPDGRKIPDEILPLGADGLPLAAIEIPFLPDAVPVQWLEAWAAELTAQPRRVPVIEPVSTISPFRKFYIVGGLAASFVLAACIGHSGWYALQTADARDRAARMEASRASDVPADTSAKDEAALTAEAEKLRPKLAQLEQREAALLQESVQHEKRASEIAARQTQLGRLHAIHRPAVPELLAALVEFEKADKSGEVVVKEVRQEGGGELRLTGLCRRSSFADSFATRLETRLTKAGWIIGAAQKRLRDDRLAFDFSLLLTPVVMSDAPLPAVPAPPKKAATITVGSVKADARAVQTSAGERR